MPEITINLSWFPAWLLWTVGGAFYVTIGLAISCLFKVREAKQYLYWKSGCGATCCAGHKCGEAYTNHKCNGTGLTTHHEVSFEFCRIGKCLSIPAWPAMLALSIPIKLCCVIKDLWWHAEQYGISHSQTRGS
jgi:hypothetical protein